MTPAGLAGIIVVAAVVIMIVFRDLGYRAGVRDAGAAGYEAGRKDADNWWIGVETGADQARRQIWREEAHL